MNYENIYKENNFKIHDIVFTKDTLKGTSLFLKSFAILTAWNPMNKQIRLKENIQRNNMLKNDIKNYNFVDAVGFLDEYYENSFCIYDITFKKAIFLAKKYEQYSIFYNNNKLGYYKVEDESLIY